MRALAQPQASLEGSLEFTLHGLALRIVCPDAAILGAIDARLTNFAGDSFEEADLSVVYDLDREPHDRPTDGRVVYESLLATAVYAPSEDALYAFHAGGGSLRCEPKLGRAEIAAGRSESREWVLSRPLLTLALMELLRRRELYPLHAACLSTGGTGVLVCGPSGSGKSTLTLALLEAGLDFLGDDLVFLQPSHGHVRALGFPDELGLPAESGSTPRLAERVDTSVPPGWPKARADVGLFAPDAHVVDACDPRLVLLLSDRVEADVIEEASADEALLELLPSILLTEPDTCAAHLAALAALTASATILRTGARPSLAAVTDTVLRTLARLNDNRKDSTC